MPIGIAVQLLLVLIIAGTIVWVWFDARARDWTGNSFGKGPWWWVIGTILFWIIVFPLYLFQRGKAPVRS